MKLQLGLVLELAARMYSERVWFSRTAFILFFFTCISFLVGAYVEMHGLFAPWTLAALIFSLSTAALWNESESLIQKRLLQRLALVGIGTALSLILWLLVNLSLLIPGPGRALIAWLPPLFLVVAWSVVALVWFANLFFGSLEKEGLESGLMHIKERPSVYLQHFGLSVAPLILFSLVAAWARHINSGAWGKMGPLFELVALAPFLIAIVFGALFFIHMRAWLEGAS